MAAEAVEDTSEAAALGRADAGCAVFAGTAIGTGASDARPVGATCSLATGTADFEVLAAGRWAEAMPAAMINRMNSNFFINDFMVVPVSSLLR